MDQVTTFKEIATGVFNDLINGHYAGMGSIEAQFIDDQPKGHFLIVLQGWQNDRYIYGTSIHVQVKDDAKVWVYRDSSSVVIIDHLERAGIPTSNMVVSWHPPVARKHTEFAEG